MHVYWNVLRPRFAASSFFHVFVVSRGRQWCTSNEDLILYVSWLSVLVALHRGFVVKAYCGAYWEIVNIRLLKGASNCGDTTNNELRMVMGHIVLKMTVAIWNFAQSLTNWSVSWNDVGALRLEQMLRYILKRWGGAMLWRCWGDEETRLRMFYVAFCNTSTIPPQEKFPCHRAFHKRVLQSAGKKAISKE